MLFNSYEFIFAYLPIVVLGFFWISYFNHRLAALWLGLASLFFYGWWNPLFVLLLLASITFNYVMGYQIGHVRGRSARGAKWLFTSAIVTNLALLGYFKYTNFFIDTLNEVAGTGWTLKDIILPLGISFFTFTQISFLADVYRGIAREYNFVHYLLFVTYFPHLIAGPVLHHKQMMPQFAHAETYKPNLHNINIGLTIFTIGLLKKVVLADQFALYADPVFDLTASGGKPQLLEAWVGALAYTLQLYFDFSGYSDMAIGLSRMFNIKLPINFNSPYKATSIIDFWKRWHMTLSAFLKDYVYISLGGNRHGATRRYTNLLVTMLVGGLWHGANWTFVAWGFLHGIYLVVNHCWHALSSKLRFPSIPGGGFFAAGLTFVAVVVAWVLFRANGLDTARRILSGMAGQDGISLPKLLESNLSALAIHGVGFNGAMPMTALPFNEILLWLSFGLGIVWLVPNSLQLAGFMEKVGEKNARLCGFAVGLCLVVAILSFKKTSPFIYFQF